MIHILIQVKSWVMMKIRKHQIKKTKLMNMRMNKMRKITRITQLFQSGR
jgi:hypothetical protein